MPNAHAPSALPRQLRAEAVSLTFSGVRALKDEWTISNPVPLPVLLKR